MIPAARYFLVADMAIVFFVVAAEGVSGAAVAVARVRRGAATAAQDATAAVGAVRRLAATAEEGGGADAQ